MKKTKNREIVGRVSSQRKEGVIAKLPREISPHWSWVLVMALGIVLVLVFFVPKMNPSEGIFIGGQDVRDYQFWCMSFFRNQVLSGDFPLWNPHMYSGHPFAANPANFVFYPFVVLYVLFPLPWAFNIDIIVHFLAAWAGMYVLTKRISGSDAASLIAAVVYTFNGHTLGRVYGGHLSFVHSTAVIPWVFIALERVFQEDKPSLFWIPGAALGLLILTGNTQIIYYTTLLVCLYVPMRYVSKFGFSQVRSFITYCAWFLLVPLVSFGIAAVFLLPVFEFISLSDRAEKLYEFAVSGSFGPEFFSSIFIPPPLTQESGVVREAGAYCGLGAIPLVLLGLMVSFLRRNLVPLAVLFCVTLTLVLGRHTPLYRFYYDWLPLLGNFRVPARALSVIMVFAALFAGIGLAYVLGQEKKRNLVISLLASVTVSLIFAALAFWVVGLDKIHHGVRHAGVFAFLSIVIFSISLMRMKNRGRIIPLVMVIFIFTDVFLLYAPGIPALDQKDLLKKEDFEDLFDVASGDYRVLVPISFNPSYPLSPLGARCNVMGYENAGGYVQVAVMDYYRFIHAMAQVPPPVKSRHTVNWELFRENNVFSSKILGIKYALAYGNDGWKLLRASWYMPRACLVHTAKVIPDYRDHLAAMKEPTFNPQEVVYLEEGDRDHLRKLHEGPPMQNGRERVTIDRYDPDRIDMSTSSPWASYLVVSELFYPGWKAYVDGQETKILRADYLLRAIPLERGSHKVTMVYRPLSFIVGFCITVLTVLGLSALGIGRMYHGGSSLKKNNQESCS